MAKLDDEQVQQFRDVIRTEVRSIVREEVRSVIRIEVRPIVREEVRSEVASQLDQKLDQKLEPLSEKLDQIRTAQLEDAAAVATDIVRHARHSADHEQRIKKLE